MDDPYSSTSEELRQMMKWANHYEKLYNDEKEKNRQLQEKIKQMSPCDRCMFNPPSSCDGKPCCMCVAQKVIDEDVEDETC